MLIFLNYLHNLYYSAAYMRCPFETKWQSEEGVFAKIFLESNLIVWDLEENFKTKNENTEKFRKTQQQIANGCGKQITKLTKQRDTLFMVIQTRRKQYERRKPISSLRFVSVFSKEYREQIN